MIRLLRSAAPHGTKVAAATIAAAAAFAAAALVGVALAKTFSLNVAQKASVSNQRGATKTEPVVVNSHGFAVYMLTGDGKSHPKCTKVDGCLRLWPPLRVSSRRQLSKAPGIKGRLGVWHRNGFFQVTLDGHPLYRYARDTRRHRATGEGVMSFGGTWHVVKPAPTSGSTTTPTTTMTTTTTPCLYPPC